MKKLALVIGVLLCVVTISSAATYNKVVTWEQDAADLPYLAHWTMVADDGQTANFVYDGTAGPFQASNSFTITGQPGDTVQVKIRLKAVATNGAESPLSNEATATFLINNMSAPVLISIE